MFNTLTARDFVEERLIAPFFRKKAQYIGVELEFPILFQDKTLNSKTLGIEFLTELIDSGEFFEETATCSPEIMRVVNSSGDSISYDYSYATIEFSMAKKHSLNEIAGNFYGYFDLAVKFYDKRGCIISGMGTNPMMPEVIEYTRSNYTDTLRQFIGEYCVQKDPRYYLCNMQSMQTHVEIPGINLTQAFNVMCLADFAKGLLLANSLPDMGNLPSGVEYEPGTLLARDFNWEGSGFPNTGLCDKPLADLEQLIDYFTDKKLCFKRDGLDFSCFEPIAIADYYQQGEHGIEDLDAFFNVERVTINLYNVLEMRGDCIQPLTDCFAPAALNIGVCYNSARAWQVLWNFLTVNDLAEYGNRELRHLAITGRLSEMIPKDRLCSFLTELLDTAKEGLRQRGFKEEQYLAPLYDRAQNLSNPALDQLDRLAQGESVIDIAKRYGAL